MAVNLGLVVHGMSPWSRQGLIEGTTILPVDPEGLTVISAQTEPLQPYQFKGIYCYQANPGKSSALALAAALYLPIVEVDLLRPVDMGIWTGLSHVEVEDRFGRMYRRWLARPDITAPPCGETLWEVAERLVPLFEKLSSGKRSMLVVASREVLISLQMLFFRERDGEVKGWPWSLMPCGKVLRILFMDSKGAANTVEE